VFTFSITEPVTMADANATQANFVSSIAENVNMADTYTVVANYAVSITEAIRLLDDICYNGWFRIDDSQTPVWTAIATPVGVWVDVNDAQTPSWGVIDTSQPCK